MSNYLTYCRLFVRELGIAGGSGPSQIEGQKGELLNVVTWIADADVAIQRLWKDWDFLWGQHTETVSADKQSVGKPTGANAPVVNILDRSSLVLRPGTQQAFRPTFLHWRDFRDSWEFVKTKTAKNPIYWTILPDGSIRFSHKFRSDTEVRYDYWRKPVRLVNANDKSLIPHDSDSGGNEDYPRIVLVRAKMIYAEREDAPEISRGAAAEYTDLLEKMESEHLRWMRQSRMSTDDEDLTVGIP